MENQKSSSRGETREEKERGKYGGKVMGDILR